MTTKVIAHVSEVERASACHGGFSLRFDTGAEAPDPEGAPRLKPAPPPTQVIRNYLWCCVQKSRYRLEVTPPGARKSSTDCETRRMPRSCAVQRTLAPVP